MIYFNKKDSVADSIKDIMEKKELSPKQKEIAKMSPPADKIDAGDLSKLRAGQKTVKEEEVQEEIDPKSRTKDTTAGRKKTDQTDDVGPGSDGKSTKVKYRGGPMNTSEEVESVEEASFNPLKHIKNPSPAVKAAAKDVKRGSYADRAALMKAGGVKDDRGPRGVTQEETRKTLRVFKEQYQDNSIFDQMIAEVLSKDAGAGDWIHDFVHSDNPKFAGKSKSQRKQMALAAYYAKQRNEEVEQIDELSKKTLASYAKNATDDVSYHSFSAGTRSAKDPERLKDDQKAMKRQAGVSKAIDRLAKEEVEEVKENSPFDWKKPREPVVNGGSGVKKGTRYGGSAQKSKPEQDDEEPKKKVTESKRTDTDNVPFDPPFNTTSDPVVTDKSGAKHTPMSRVKHLAKLAMKRVKKDVQGK